MCWEIRGGDCLSWCFLDATPPEWKYEDRSKNNGMRSWIFSQVEMEDVGGEHICVNTGSLGVLVYLALDSSPAYSAYNTYVDMESTSRPDTTSLVCENLAPSDIASSALES